MRLGSVGCNSMQSSHPGELNNTANASLFAARGNQRARANRQCSLAYTGLIGGRLSDDADMLADVGGPSIKEHVRDEGCQSFRPMEACISGSPISPGRPKGEGRACSQRREPNNIVHGIFYT